MRRCNNRFGVRGAVLGGVAMLAGLASGVAAETTGFDGLGEDFYGDTFTHDGITFQNAFSSGEPRTFSIDDATDLWTDWGVTEWAEGNVLGMGAYSNGSDGVAFSAISSIEMTTGAVVNSAEFTFLYILDDGNNDYAQNTMTLEAILDGSVVHSELYTPGNEIYDSGRSTYGATRFSLGGVDFDTLRLSVDGQVNEGRVAGVIDNVTITPAPASMAMLAMGGLAAGRRKR